VFEHRLARHSLFFFTVVIDDSLFSPIYIDNAIIIKVFKAILWQAPVKLKLVRFFND